MSDESSGPPLDVTVRDFAAGQKVFNRYTLIRTLGRGGMGIVWLAHDEVLDRDVALKFLPELIIHDRAVLEDLKKETKRSLELTHKNIVRIYDFVHDVVSGCISMEYIEGDTLSNLRADKASKIFEPDEIKPWLSQLCDALDYAHNHARIIHRDLKPSNLMISRRGHVKVADFGIARSLSDSVSMLTHARGTSGTLVYMSPQQLDGERGTHLDDIYSLGATIYELLTSKPPFYSGNIDRQIHEKIPPSMSDRRKELEIEGSPIPKNWEETVAACLSKDPKRRPQSISEIVERLQLGSLQSSTDIVRPQRWQRKTMAAIVATLGLVVFVALSLFVIERNKSPSQPLKQSESSITKTSTVAKPRTRPLLRIWMKTLGDYLYEAPGAKNIPPLRSIDKGVVIFSIGQHGADPKSPLQPFDVITQVDGTPVTTSTEFWNAIEKKSADQDIELTVWRTDHSVKVTVTPEDLALAKSRGALQRGESELATRLLEDAAAKGHPEAETALGDLYSEGYRIRPDYAKATEYYQKAADHNDPVGQYSLGVLYEQGKGVPQNLTTAIELYKKAAQRGDAEAKKRLERIEAERQSAATATASSETSSAPTSTFHANAGYEPAVAFVDMNKVFKEFYKTKNAEAEINKAKDAAKKEYDDRVNRYKAALEEINALNTGTPGLSDEAKARKAKERDTKIADIKQMERDINDFRISREKQLQTQALKLREEIVAEIMARIKQLAGPENLIIDKSGNSLNGVPVFVFSPDKTDMSQKVIDGLNQGLSSAFNPMNGLSIGLIDMNKVFKAYHKTKDSETKINEAKATAKKELDDRSAVYKQKLDAINKMRDSPARNQAMTDIKTVEREINEFKQTREKQLQDQTLKLREGIVADITKLIGERMGACDNCMIVDVSGNSLNGVPIVLYTKGIPDFSDATISGLNDKTGTKFQLIPTKVLRFGKIDMERAFKALPETKQAEAEVSATKEKTKRDLGDKPDPKVKEAREKEDAAAATKSRDGIVDKLKTAATKLSADHNFNFVFDSSGKSLNGVPVLLSSRDIPDLTDEVIAKVESR